MLFEKVWGKGLTRVNLAIRPHSTEEQSHGLLHVHVRSRIAIVERPANLTEENLFSISI